MLGFPVVLAIALPCLAYIFVKDLPIELLAQRTLYSLDSFPLVAVPVFLFVGSVMNRAGISRYIYRFADTAVGRLPGGVAQVNIFGSLIFAGMSGSALADIGGLGRIEIDAMRNKGFNAPFAAAVTSSSAIVGPDLSAVDSAHHLRHGDRCLGDPAAARRHPAGHPLRDHADDHDRMACAAPQLPARRTLADRGRALARLQASPAGDPGPRDPHRRDADGILHADGDRFGHRALCAADLEPVLPRGPSPGRESSRRATRPSVRLPASC